MSGNHHELKRILHMSTANGLAELEQEHQRRLASSACMKWDFTVGDHQLFCVVTAEMSAGIERIFSQEFAIHRLWESLPPIARSHYLFALLVHEVVASNEIEGIHSTRREIEEALDRAEGEKKKRFHEFANLYLRLGLGRDLTFPTDLDELRTTYDLLLGSEISAADRPDGDRFRAGSVKITDGRSEVHSGLEPESAIEAALQQFLAAMAPDQGNRLVGTLAGHFMFEYVHPFYDGNGRYGRFLLSLALQKILSTTTALTMSRILSEERTAYYRAFSITEEPLNRAEVTFFVVTLLGALERAQRFMMDELRAKADRLSELQVALDGLRTATGVGRGAHAELLEHDNLAEREWEAFACLAQAHIFAEGRGIVLDEVVDHVGKTAVTCRKYMSALEDSGLAETVSLRPLRWVLTDQAKKLLDLA